MCPSLSVDSQSSNRAALTLNSSILVLGQLADEGALLESICRVIVESGYRMALVAFAEQGEQGTLRLAASAGGDAPLLQFLRLGWLKADVHAKSPIACTIRSGKPTVIHDFETDSQL